MQQMPYINKAICKKVFVTLKNNTSNFANLNIIATSEEIHWAIHK